MTQHGAALARVKNARQETSLIDVTNDILNGFRTRLDGLVHEPRAPLRRPAAETSSPLQPTAARNLVPHAREPGRRLTIHVLQLFELASARWAPASPGGERWPHQAETGKKA
jgi:hypothetical protein